MDYWEFLLQRDGDGSWLPLEVAQVEILEGRYRIMAHTSRLEQPVEVRIHQLMLDRHPPKRRTLKRSGKIEDSGLLVVMPFTWLTAGQWDISCSQPGEAPDWHYGVQLQVQPQDGDDWFTDDDSPQVRGEPLSQASSQVPEPTLAQTVSPAIDRDLASPPPLTLPPEDLAHIFALAPAASPMLTLSQSAWVGSKGQTLTLSGQGLSIEDASPPLGYLVAQLVDPQTGLPVWSGQQMVTVAAPFSLELTLPTALDTRLLLGELRLVVPAADDARFELLATGRFTVTVDLADLFDRMANQGETQPDLGVVFPADGLFSPDAMGADSTGADETISDAEPAPAAPPLDLPQPAPRAIPVVTLPTDGQGLPPRLYYPTDPASAREPVLPPLAPPPTVPLAAQLTDPAAKADLETAELTSDAAPETALDHSPDPALETIAEAPPPPTSESSPERLSEQPPGQTANATPPNTPPPSVQLPSFVQPQRTSEPTPAVAAAPPPTPVPLLMDSTTSAFRSLNLENRFWQRLNTLAVELQQQATSPASAPAAREDRTGDVAVEAKVNNNPGDNAIDHDPDQENTADLDATTFPGEVVIYEDLPLPEALAEPPTDPTEPAPELGPPAPPELILPTGELVAGEGLGLQVRVPIHPNRLYLKVWMVDPQTRTLADAPRQLMTLMPDGEGYLGSPLQLTVPQGCLELWFEAVAVDMVTQQESYKTTVVRPVRPANLPAEELPEFDL